MNWGEDPRQIQTMQSMSHAPQERTDKSSEVVISVPYSMIERRKLMETFKAGIYYAGTQNLRRVYLRDWRLTVHDVNRMHWREDPEYIPADEAPESQVYAHDVTITSLIVRPTMEV